MIIFKMRLQIKFCPIRASRCTYIIEGWPGLRVRPKATPMYHFLRLFELTPINWEVVEQIVHGYLMQPVVINHGHGTVSEKEVVKSIKRQYRTLLSQNVGIPH